MKTSTAFVSVLSCVATLAGAMRPSIGLPEGYRLTNLTWTGNITENGPEMKFTGIDIQDIDAQIHRANPSFAWPKTNSTAVADGEAWLTCDPNNIWYAQAFRIEEGIEYLKEHAGTGRCTMGAGPRVCTRISCSYKSAIHWCNDNSVPIEENCMLWNHYAQDILDTCRSNDATNRVRGQKFSAANWNILVGFDDDHC